ncbi:lytic transglycosylase domain-containing protein [Haliovirga abyssi]|uniref:Transglycosylase SLT domain-containing protein n=1 Tax=Haliovirga abyssi TaxID=2996794 RepID=A0AAU9D6N4_9FUSO|nr:lytic transglycosylase domain-containing protein [Haliovirga abyssi]BDU50208.1 hypothetical protein HLVA_07770 [Haliovirga abyssi]
MKYILISIFIIFNINIYAININDYVIFSKAEKLYESNKFDVSETLLENLFKNYSDSNLIKSTYPHYFLGKILFQKKDYKNAIKYLKQTTYHKYEVYFLLGKSYSNINKDLSLSYYSKLFSKKYNSKKVKYEKLALQDLALSSNKYKNIYQIKYLHNFKNIKKLSYNQLIDISDFFFSVGKYNYSKKLYKFAEKLKPTNSLEIKIIKTLFSKKEYPNTILYANNILKNNIYKSKIYYYIGSSYRRVGKLDKAILYLKKVKITSLLPKVNYIIGKLYYFEHKYDKSLKYLNLSNYLEAYGYKLKIYSKLKNSKEYYIVLNEMLKKSLYSDLSAEYRYKTYLKTKEKKYIEEIIKYNYNSYYYELAKNILEKQHIKKKYNLEDKLKTYSHLILKLNAIADLDFYEGCLIEINQFKFNKNEGVLKNYLKVKYLEKSNFYHLALKQSYKYYYSFSRYNEFTQYLYPKYYKEFVEYYASKSNLEPELIYSIIKQESNFKDDEISNSSAYGLMQLILPTAKSFQKNILYEDLLDPELNIKIGTKYLKLLYKKYNGNLIPIIASYNAGETNVNRWIKKHKKLTIDDIPFAETKNYVKKVLNNYYKYKELYR